MSEMKEEVFDEILKELEEIKSSAINGQARDFIKDGRYHLEIYREEGWKDCFSCDQQKLELILDRNKDKTIFSYNRAEAMMLYLMGARIE